MFRIEAVKAQQKKLHGDVFLTQPVSSTIITFVIAAMVGLAAILLTTGSYARSEHVAGYIVPSKGLIKIQASQFGTLDTLHVREGDKVISGQVLADITIAHGTFDGRSFVEKSLDALTRQRNVIETQITLEKNQLETELAKLSSEQAEAALRATSLENRIVLQKQITASAEAAYKDVQGILEQGYISKAESERRLQTWLSQQANEQLRRHELVEAQALLEQLAIRLSQLPNESKQRVARLETQLSELDSRTADQEGRQAYSIIAPVSGYVASINVGGEGRTVQAGQPLLAILPEGSDLEAELYVPSRAAGFIKSGQEVRLLYDAFPYQRFGSYPAKITYVTETILTPNEALAPFEIKEPVYRVTAAIDETEITARGAKVTLQSGMTLKANIVLERRSFLDWLLEPLRAIGGRA